MSKAFSYPLSVISVDNDGELSRGVLCHEKALFFEFGASASRYYRGSVRVASERPQWRLTPDVQTASSDNDERLQVAGLSHSGSIKTPTMQGRERAVFACSFPATA